jgi:hypothetical protein
LTYASEITEAARVYLRKIRQGMGQEAPLQQQRQAPGAGAAEAQAQV